MPTATLNTEELLIDAKSGNEVAINQLFGHHQESLRKMIRIRLDKRIQNRIGVSDVLQNVLIDAHRRLRKYLESPSMPFHLWLRQIAKDRMIDSYRRHRGSAKRSVDREQQMTVPRGSDKSSLNLANLIADSQLTPEVHAIKKEMAKQVNASIALLSRKDSEIIVMRHVDNLTNQEISNVLGLSEPAASMRYLRAIRRLREVIQGEKHESLNRVSV